MRDPEFLRQTMQMMKNPAARKEMMRNQGSSLVVLDKQRDSHQKNNTNQTDNYPILKLFLVVSITCLPCLET